MLYSNFHTHTYRCQHATGTEREYIEGAISIGINELGFSDHCPIPFDSDYVSGIRMTMDQAEGYVSTIRALADEYKSQIKIHVGFEMEYLTKYFDKQIQFFENLGIDYLIMGQHFWTDENGGKYSGSPSSKEELTAYVDSVIEGMSTGKYLYLCHPDLINYSIDKNIYRQEMTRLCLALKQLNAPLEMNVLGYSTNRHYPNPDFWDIASKVGCDAVIGLDAHSPEQMVNIGGYNSCEKELLKRNISIKNLKL